MLYLHVGIDTTDCCCFHVPLDGSVSVSRCYFRVLSCSLRSTAVLLSCEWLASPATANFSALRNVLVLGSGTFVGRVPEFLFSSHAAQVY